MARKGEATPQAVKNKISAARKGKGHPYTEETRQKVRVTRLGKPHPHKGGYKSPNKGKPRPKEICKRISASHKGKPFWSSETREQMSCRWRGENNPVWKGGISYEPYCPKFNEDFKRRVRLFFNDRCVLCGVTSQETERGMDVHHVNYDKMVCCNGTKPLFVSLCRKCHTKTLRNREYWNAFFEQLIETKYNGQCYLPKGV